jgi:catechol 2,3-dioxygenase-like lactoylglutathione lyase family enzyme
MIEGISAVTLATHDMRRAVRFYCSLGFDILYGGEASSFTSFRAGAAYLNLIAQADHKHWSWWGRWRPDTSLRPCPATPNGANAIFI